MSTTLPKFQHPAMPDLNQVSGSAKILLLDDDEIFLHLCKNYLKKSDVLNFDLIIVNTLKRARLALEMDSFDCVVVDYSLPDGNGVELINELAEDVGDAMPGTIVLTGDSGGAAAIDAVKAGASDYLQKADMTKSSLCRAVSNAIQKSQLRMMHFSRVKELEVSNDTLKRRNEEIQRFYHTVSHEVKTPLTAIQEFVSIVNDGLAGEVSEEQKTILNYALESCDQIKIQFDELLEMSRFETGKMQVTLEPSNLSEVFNHCIIAATPSALAKNITLRLANDDFLPPVMMHPSRIIQVVSNLVGNAIKFTPEGGQVIVDAELVDLGDRVRLSVADSGCGIPAKDCEQIFERLYQVTPGSDLENESGMGLGLSISSQIIELHGGHIDVNSTLGEGSEFSFHLNTQRLDQNEAAVA